MSAAMGTYMSKENVKAALARTIQYGERSQGWGMAVEDDIAGAYERGELSRDDVDDLYALLDANHDDMYA
jgi:hypothetical protein